MALTARERQARRRAKLKASKESYNNMLEKDRVRKAIYRAKKNETMTDEEREEFRMSERERVQEYRDSKKNEQLVDSTTNCEHSPYGSVQACGKAVKRINLSLPKSPRKRLFVIKKIAKSAGLSIQKSDDGKEGSRRHSGIHEDTLKEVHDFYLTDEVSWQAPGKKDRVIIRELDDEGIKRKRTQQVRYMLMSLSEAYRLFSSTHASSKIGHSKFCELRPCNVKLFDHIPHNVCVCSYHENVRLLLQSLKGETDLSTEFHAFIEQITCDSTTKECMNRKCSTCASSFDNFQPRNPDARLQLYQWRNQNGEKIDKVLTECTAGEAFMELKKQLDSFLIHTYVKRCQAAFLRDLTLTCDTKNIVVQVDFSENATILAQNEIQSAHWNHGQATLFTAHAWISNEKRENIVIISDCLNHTKYSVYVFIDYILSHLKENHPAVEIVNFFSDGASSQFKQRYLFSNFHQWEVKHAIKLSWNFFATSHGKGVVDGLGGTVKRSVWRYVRSGKAIITSAEEYASTASERNPNVYIHFIAESVISGKITELDAHWEGVLPVLKTQKLHSVFPTGAFDLTVSDVSNSLEKTVVPIRINSDSKIPQTVENYKVGQWVVVRYDDIEYRGEILKVIKDDLQVNVMHESETGSYWKWPEKSDIIFYNKNDVVKVINPPTIYNARGLYKF